MRSILKRIQWPLAGTLATGALILGFVGFSNYFAATGEARSGWDILYVTLQLFVLESGSVWGPVPLELQVARLLAPAVAGYAAVGALAILFREQFQRLRVRFFRNHVIVCALGRKGLLLTKSLRLRGYQVVVIEEDAENDLIETAREYGAVVLIGDARDLQILRRAGIHHAGHLVALSGDDGVNAEVAVRARSLVSRGRSRPLTCIVHVVDPELCGLLRIQEMGRGEHVPFRLDFFNVFESGARALLNDFPLEKRQAGDSAPFGHIAVVGLGRFGESVVLQAARHWRSEMDTHRSQLRITVADQDATARIESLLVRYPWLSQASDLHPADVSFDSREFAEARFLFDEAEGISASAVFVCVDGDSRGISAGLTLYRGINDRAVPIFVRTVHGAGLASLLRHDGPAGEEYSNLHAFALLDRTCHPDILFAGTNEVLARAMHEEYVRDQKRQGETAETNPAVVPWEDLEESQQDSNRAQAAHIGVKLAAVGCDLAPLADWNSESFSFGPSELESLAQMEHERWREERERAGWKVGAKDPGKLRSPYLVDWEDLDEDVKELDRLFIRGLPRFLARAGFQIVRVRS